MFTLFYDMHSGGGQKESFSKLAVELPENEAVEWFKNKFGHDPFNITCNCCGCDYSVSESETLDELTKCWGNVEVAAK